jgi:hypothetical protein
VSAVSELSFGGSAYNTSAGASTPTGGAAIMIESDPAIIAANRTVTPSPTIFVGTPGPGRSGSIGRSGASATGTVTGAASGLLAEEIFAGYAGLAWGIMTLTRAL